MDTCSIVTASNVRLLRIYSNHVTSDSLRESLKEKNLHFRRIVTGKTQSAAGLKLVPERQPIAGAGNLFAKENQKTPFKVEYIGRKYADDYKSYPECCFVIHAVYWPVL